MLLHYYPSTNSVPQSTTLATHYKPKQSSSQPASQFGRPAGEHGAGRPAGPHGSGRPAGWLDCRPAGDEIANKSTVLSMTHSGLIGAIWFAPPCKLYSQLRKDDGGPPPLRTKEYLDGLPSLSPHQLLQIQESKEVLRRSSSLCIAVFQQGGFAATEQPMNPLAWSESFHQQFLEQCSCYVVATPACTWGLDWYKTWAIAATSDRIQSLAGQCTHSNHQDFRGKRLPDGSFISALTAAYPSKFASSIIEVINRNHRPSTRTQWKQLLAKRPIARGPRITDGAGNSSSAN